MIKCDINEVMDEIKGMTIREKDKFLKKLSNELYDFALKVDDLRDTIIGKHPVKITFIDDETNE